MPSMPMPRCALPPTPAAAHRRGNALILTLGIAGVVAGAIVLSATAATDSFTATVRRAHQQEARAACSVVLDRYEARIIAIGNNDPAGLDIVDNFGVDSVGAAEVRWKIEPVRSIDKADDGATAIPFIQNPRPANTGPGVDPVDPATGELTNENRWLFRVMAEASIGIDPADAARPPLARAIGARYVSVNKSPLFKHIIFYAQRGPKGDLELSHSGPAYIDGSVHSNGAIYIGAAPRPLDRDAVFGPDGRTIIGRFARTWSDSDGDGVPDDERIVYDGAGLPVPDTGTYARVVGVDGVFRLSKPLMFAAINRFPMGGIGNPGSGWLPEQVYDLAATLMPGETVLPDLSGAFAATASGTRISPFRIRPGAGPIADGGLVGDATRTINGVPLRGSGALWNDSRNQDGGDAYAWRGDALRPYSPDPGTGLPRGFNGYVRTLQNGGGALRLPAIFDPRGAASATGEALPSRPLEPQRLVYADVDRDPTTDDHAWARPQFLNPDGSATTAFPTAAAPVEAPGTYLSYALGGANYAMRRLANGSGWEVIDRSGGAAVDAKPTGLVIRERPMPAADLWPGTSPVPVDMVPANDARWMPFAYGKQWYPTQMPFRVADVSDNLIRASSDPWIDINTAPAKNRVNYTLGGTLAVTAANWPGNNRYDGSSRIRFDNFNTARSAGKPDPNNSGNDRRTYRMPRSLSLPQQRTGNRIRTHNDQDAPAGRILYGGFDPMQSDDANGTFRPYAGTSGGTNINGNSEGYGRLPYFYRDNWKFVHLQGMPLRPQSELGPGIGLTRTAIQDSDGANTTWTNCTDISEFTLSALGVRAIATDNLSSGGGAFNFANINAAIGLSAPYSVRWEGYLVPPESGIYEFFAGPTTSFSPAGSVSTTLNDGMQAWLLDRPDVDAFRPLFRPLATPSLDYRERHTWTTVSAADISGDLSTTGNGQARNRSAAIRLQAGVAYPIVIQHYKATSGNGAAALSWTGPGIGSAPAPIAAIHFRPRPAGTGGGFDLPAFQAVQAEVDLASLRSGPASQKIGLMLRGASGMGPLLNGADPYIALLFNPQRGIFAQFRLQRAAHVQASVFRYYIAAGSGPSGVANPQGEILDDPSATAAVSRTGTMQQISLTARQIESSYETPNRTYVPATATYAEIPAVYTGPMSKVTGDGKTYAIMDNFVVGTYRGVIRATATKRHRMRNYWDQIVRLSDDGWPGFTDADGGSRTIRFFTAATGTSQIANGSSTLQRGAAPNGNGDWTLLTNAYAPDPTESASNRRRVGRRFYTSYNYGPWASFTCADQAFPSAGNPFGSPTTIWTAQTAAPRAGSLPRVNWNGVERTATLADLQFITGISFTTDSRNPSQVWSAVQGIANAATPYPADTACTPALARTDDPGLADFSVPRTFSYPRTSNAIFDINSYVTTGGSWLTTMANQYLPCPNNTSAWTPLGTTGWPRTGGFRPDRWGFGVAGAPASMSDAITPLLELEGNPNEWDLPLFSDPAKLPYREVGRDDLRSAVTDLAADSTRRLWLRIEWSQAGATSGTATLKYRIAPTPPTGSADFTTLKTIPVSIPGFVRTASSPTGSQPQILAGVCVQSGDYDRETRAVFHGLRVEADGAVIDAATWDQAMTPRLARYMASQYQVFWGQRDITEAFFDFDSANGSSVTTATRVDDLCASETWFFQPREFWSQRRQWEFMVGSGAGATSPEKDPYAAGGSTFDSVRYRELLGKVTALRLNMRAIQRFLTTRTLQAAMQRPFSGHPVPSIADVRLASAGTDNHFNGLIYAARTNRYPWNPLRTAPAGDSGINPWSPSASFPLPNSRSPTADPVDEAVANAQALSHPVTAGAAMVPVAPAPWVATRIQSNPEGEPATMWHASPAASSHRLQPYSAPATAAVEAPFATDLPAAPPLKPEEFHHAVMIAEADGIDWGYPATGTADFGASKTSIITPNALYLHGNLNTRKHVVNHQGGVYAKVTPLAVIGDSITLLSNAWRPENAQAEGIAATWAGAVEGGGAVADVAVTRGPTASTTSYHAAIATCNLPSTRTRVMEGQSAPFVDAMLLIENWDLGGAELHLHGSLVVLDSRRYSRAFLLDQPKTHGGSPFGFTLTPTADQAWLGIFAQAGSPCPPRDPTLPDWRGSSPQVYGTPIKREFVFNPDLLTAAGTPPFTPFGVTATGVGSWLRSSP